MIFYFFLPSELRVWRYVEDFGGSLSMNLMLINVDQTLRIDIPIIICLMGKMMPHHIFNFQGQSLGMHLLDSVVIIINGFADNFHFFYLPITCSCTTHHPSSFLPLFSPFI